MLAPLTDGDGEMRQAVRAACLLAAITSYTPAFAQTATLLEKTKDWSVYTATGSAKLCFAVSQPKTMTPKTAKRGPIFFYISRWPAEHVDNEVSVKMGYPFKPGATVTLTVGTEKFDLFTKEEGAFVEKPEMESKLVEAMKKGGKMKIEGKSSKGTATSDDYSLDGFAEAFDRMAKDCSS
jgi:invasion protein IalB